MTLMGWFSAASAGFSVFSGSRGNTTVWYLQQARQLASVQPPEGFKPSGGLAAIGAQADETAGVVGHPALRIR